MADKLLEFLQQLVNGLSQGSIYALIALGYTMVFGVLRFINFALGDVYMLGAFAGLYFGAEGTPICGRGVAAWGMPLGDLLNPAAWVILLVAMALCAVIGIVIERLCYRPLRD